MASTPGHLATITTSTLGITLRLKELFIQLSSSRPESIATWERDLGNFHGRGASSECHAWRGPVSFPWEEPIRSDLELGKLQGLSPAQNPSIEYNRTIIEQHLTKMSQLPNEPARPKPTITCRVIVHPEPDSTPKSCATTPQNNLENLPGYTSPTLMLSVSPEKLLPPSINQVASSDNRSTHPCQNLKASTYQQEKTTRTRTRTTTTTTTTNNQQLTSNKQQATSNNQQPTTNKQQSTINNQQ